jgi:hypothetical protein
VYHYIKNVDDMVIFNMHMMITMSSCNVSINVGQVFDFVTNHQVWVFFIK